MATQLNNSGVLFPDGTTQTTGLLGLSNSTTTNTALGNQALTSGNTGSYNTAIGVLTLNRNTNGTNNTATGTSALYNNTSGNTNTAMGVNAMSANSTGSGNTANGVDAMRNNTTGVNNVAVGVSALYNNTTGSETLALGAFTLFNNQNSDRNTAIGYRSQFAFTFDDQNTSVGYEALSTTMPVYPAQYTYYATALAVGETYIIQTSTDTDWMVCGAPNNNVGTRFVAVSSAQTGTNYAYLQSLAGSNTALGYQALHTNGNDYNVAVGHQASYSNLTGSDTTAIGAFTLFNNTNGYQNTAVGRSALQANTTGVHNTAVGWLALYSNTTGSWNTAVGRQSLAWQTGGTYCTAIGFNSMPYGQSPKYCTAIGANALVANTTGEYNTAVGGLALGALGAVIAVTSMVVGQIYVIGYTGNTNWSAIGAPSNIPGTQFTYTGGATGNGNVVPINSAPDRSTAIGHYALGRTFGDNNIGIGYYAGISGYGPAIVNQNNNVIIGNNSNSFYWANVGWSYGSDIRYKNVYGPCPHGMDFINNINPIEYDLKTSIDDDTPNGPKRYGFSAQEILALEDPTDSVIINTNFDRLLITPDSLLPVMVNALKELKAEIESLKARLTAGGL